MSSASVDAPLFDATAMRHAGRDVLSLALIETRNRTLAWLGILEGGADVGAAPAWWLAGRAGWWQERWIARNVERSRGEAADATRVPLGAIDPDADAWWAEPPPAPAASTPSADTVRAYLGATLEITLDLLEGAGEDDAALHFFRAALFEEDAFVRRFVALAQARGVAAARALLPQRSVRAARPAVWWPSQRWRLGSERGGYVPAEERWAHDESVPEFEIDAQAVTWSQFAEFVEDGGYDERAHWSEPGWRWLQADGRRTPRDVEQMRGGALLQRFGRVVRVPGGEPVAGLSVHEADAWCRWAGRRLPTEIEWELAASLGASRGITWGDVPECTAGRARAWPGGPPVADSHARVQRGAAWFEPQRLAHPKARRFVAPERDDGFAGLRSCAI
jgi:formylglycine-generating enzyme required for sulfatase activity